MKNVAEAAKGRWPELLSQFAISLPPRGKHGPCPACGGRDRFRFDDKEGRGTFYCSGCGAGDGFILLRKVRGLSLQAAADLVAVTLGITPDRKPTGEGDPKKAMRALWARGTTPQPNRPVMRYLEGRLGLRVPPLDIRECMDVYDPDSKHRHPAMLAKVVADDEAVNLHITYLTREGRRAPLDKAKRVMAGKLPEGSCVRLAAPAATMGIAEGIETALAAQKLFGMPVWAALSSTGLSRWKPPAICTKVFIFGDNDENYAGHAAAYALAHRLVTAYHREVEIVFPNAPGDDWCNALEKMNAMIAMGEEFNQLTGTGV